ncbi:MAG: hypothetical protein ACR2NU_03210, partial [Aeoliella sp.]
MPGVPGAPYRMAQQPQRPPQMAAHQAPAPQQGSGFTQKLTGMIPGQSKPAPQSAPALQKTDPIALGFASGPPSPELYLSMAQLSDRGGNAQHARSMYQRTLSMQPNNL